MNGVEEQILNFFRESGEIKERFVRESLVPLTAVIRAIAQALEAGNKILLFGNGGSAADAQHIAAEFVNRISMERPPLPAVSLVTDASVLTSISNDYSFAEVFAKQIKALGRSGDIAMGISTSGNSLNVVRAFEAAREIGLVTVALTGNNGGAIAEMVDYALIVPSDKTPRIQEAHITVGHVICEMVEHLLFRLPT
ncbi:MAG: D-sedoheptulose 7-phosphate isomerase [Deltaproteobacteria bacterium]|nr:D-sedoheptulose 7-phosphate isomerase [Deltaproteobacteria bacterium]MBW2123501.1 D-sedoheptulose 7-phosphate isomerase [Deltaproteobacteria bacterium]